MLLSAKWNPFYEVFVLHSKPLVFSERRKEVETNPTFFKVWIDSCGKLQSIIIYSNALCLEAEVRKTECIFTYKVESIAHYYLQCYYLKS